MTFTNLNNIEWFITKDSISFLTIRNEGTNRNSTETILLANEKKLVSFLLEELDGARLNSGNFSVCLHSMLCSSLRTNEIISFIQLRPDVHVNTNSCITAEGVAFVQGLQFIGVHIVAPRQPNQRSWVSRRTMEPWQNCAISFCQHHIWSIPRRPHVACLSRTSHSPELKFMLSPEKWMKSRIRQKKKIN